MFGVRDECETLTANFDHSGSPSISRDICFFGGSFETARKDISTELVWYKFHREVRDVQNSKDERILFSSHFTYRSNMYYVSRNEGFTATYPTILANMEVHPSFNFRGEFSLVLSKLANLHSWT